MESSWLELAVARYARERNLEEATKLAKLSLPHERRRTPLLRELLADVPNQERIRTLVQGQ